ncbi:MAG TPA: class II aldolase/adducin family protein [Dehalococcoidia bacterium]|nr:class II aldolase/adducin family protein [Dehalococcoidia bacterium]
MIDTALTEFQIVGAELRAAGLVSSHGGNLSIWTPDGTLITGEGAMLGRLGAGDLCLIGRTTLPPHVDPSLDAPIHRAAYALSDARAIVHAHPAHAVALAFDRNELLPHDNEGRLLLGRVPVLVHARDIVRQVGEALAERTAVLVRGHGCYVRGADLGEALRHATQLEESARLLFLRHQLARVALPS